MHTYVEGMGCIMSGYGAIMVNSSTALISFDPIAWRLDPLFASKDFGLNKDALGRIRFPKCDHNVVIGQWPHDTGSIQNWPIFGNNFLYW